MSKKWTKKLILAAAILLCAAVLKMLLGTCQLMYFTAAKYPVVTAEFLPRGTVLTLDDAQRAELAPLLTKVVFYGRADGEESASEGCRLHAVRADGRELDVVFRGGTASMNGKTYRVKGRGYDNVAAWLDALNAAAAAE